MKEGELATGNQTPARTALEATLSIGSVLGSYGVGGLDVQSKIVGLILIRNFVLF